MAVNLIELLSPNFSLDNYKDTYRQAICEIIEAKVAGREIATPNNHPDKGNVVDLMEVLRASVKFADEYRNKINNSGITWSRNAKVEVGK